MRENGTNNSRQAAWVAIGSLFSFLVGIVSPMILSRYFDKADYGTYKQVMYVYNTLLAVFTLGLPKAYSYFLPKFEAKYSRDIVNKITNIFWILGAVFSLLLFFGAGTIARLLGNPDLYLALRYFAIVPVFMLPTMGLDSICASFQRTKILAIYTVTSKLFIIACTILPVIFMNGNYIHAIIGFDIASAISCLLALIIKNKLTACINKEKSLLTVKEIFGFSLPLLNASLWGMVIASSTQFFISRYYGNDVFADFSNGFMEIPFVGMIIGASATVLLPAFSKMDKGTGMTPETLNLWTSSMIKSAKIIFPMLVYSVFFAETIMTCMYGNQYASSSYYFMIKNISGLFYIIPFAPIILAIGKTKEYARVHMLVALMIVLLEYLAVTIIDTPISVAITGEACNMIKIILMSWIISKYAQLRLRNLYMIRPLLKILLCCVVSCCTTYMILNFASLGKFVVLFISLILFLFIYAIVCKLFKVKYRDIAESILPQRLSFIIRLLP